jgi:hypothetical protein
MWIKEGNLIETSRQKKTCIKCDVQSKFSPISLLHIGWSHIIKDDIFINKPLM